MDDKKKNILLALLAIFLIVILIYYNRNNLFQKDPTIITKDISMVTDNSRFFTVASCVSKYVSYLSNDDLNNLLLLLDVDYKEKNSITNSNITQYVTLLNNNYEFNADVMYEEKENDDVMRYYVSGTIKPDTYYDSLMDSYKVQSEKFYAIVNLNLREGIFSIVPYDGEVFLDGGAS